MKKVILILAAAALASCQKPGMEESENEETANACTVVTNEAVPAVVQDAFLAKYPQNAAEKWFNKDDQGFSALFTQNGSRTVAQFDNDGAFRTEISPVPVTNPPSNTPGNQPSCGNHPPKPKCGQKPHHKPHPFIPMMHKKKHHECGCHKDAKKQECQVMLTE
jgi:hypothetical protein